MRDTRDPETGETILPWKGMTLSEARNLVSGWHFAKEMLTPAEEDMFHVAEGLLNLLDAEDPKGYRR